MRLHSPEFERSLRRSVKQAIRKSPELKREARRSSKVTKHYNAVGLVRVCLSCLLGGAVLWIASATGHPAAALALVSAWTFGVLFFQCRSLLTVLYTSADLPALSLLPADGATVFRWELQKWLRRAPMSLLDLLVALGALTVYYGLPGWKYPIVLIIAVMSWIAILTLALLGGARLARLPYPQICGCLFLIAFMLLVGHWWSGPVVLKILDQHSLTFNLALPTGWVVSQFQLLLPESQWPTLGLLIPVGVLVWTIKSSLARLRMGYGFTESAFEPAADIVPVTKSEPEGTGNTPSPAPRPFHLGPTAIEEIIETRQFLEMLPWGARGWLEKTLWRWMSERERALSDLAFPAGIDISKRWKRIFCALSIFAVVGFLAGAAIPSSKIWVIGFGVFISFVFVLVQIMDTGRAFQKVPIGGAVASLYTSFPVGLRELSAFLIKYSAVQLPLLLGWAATGGVLLTVSSGGGGVVDGIWYGLRGGCLIFSGRYVLLATSFSSGTNDTAGLKPGRFIMNCLILGMMGSFLLLGAIGLLLPRHEIAWILIGLAVLTAFCMLKVYAWYYHANLFDLIKLPAQRSS